MEYIEKIGYRTPARIKAKLESIAYYPFHIHNDDVEIICVLNGTVKICDSAATYALSYGDVHIFNKKDPHKITSDDPSSMILTVQMDCSHYKHFFDHLNEAYFICDTSSAGDPYPLDIKYLRFQLARLYRLYASKKTRDLALEACGKELLELLLSHFQQYVYQEAKGKTANIVRLQNVDHLYKNYARMYRVVDYVYDHFHEKLSLRHVAQREYLSPAHLSRYMKETLGLTFSQLVSLARCEEASLLLSATRKTVDQIAEEVGFANRKHLAVQFKKWYEKTPSQYRNAILKDLNSTAQVKLRSFDYAFSQIILDMYLDEY